MKIHCVPRRNITWVIFTMHTHTHTHTHTHLYKMLGGGLRPPPPPGGGGGDGFPPFPLPPPPSPLPPQKKGREGEGGRGKGGRGRGKGGRGKGGELTWQNQGKVCEDWHPSPRPDCVCTERLFASVWKEFVAGKDVWQWSFGTEPFVTLTAHLKGYKYFLYENLSMSKTFLTTYRLFTLLMIFLDVDCR